MLIGVITLASGRVDHIGGVEPAAETDFQQHDIGRMLREQTERRRGLDLEKRDRRAGIDALAMLQHAARSSSSPTSVPPPRSPRRKHSLIRTR